MKVGIIGKGYVGGAMYECFKDKFEVEVYDTDEAKRTIDTLESLVEWTDYLFVSVPTPMSEDGSCNTSIVESVVDKIANIRKDKIVVIKSTVPPGTSASLAKKHGLKIAFNPEFLTEANYIQDFRYQPLIVVGADQQEVKDKIWELYFSYVSKAGYMPKMKDCTTAEAEMFKYMANTFLAVKVVFANELKLLCNKVGIEYNNVADIAKLDARLGSTHWNAPGPDGKLGYGGSCFPKDTSALSYYADSVGSTLWLLTEAMYINDEIRGENLLKIEFDEDK
jgi:nucleotide sugar dehydrogenase